MSAQRPETPFTQRALSAASQNSTTSLFTPEAEMSVQKLKRSFNERSNQESPKNADLFISWRKKVLEEKIALFGFQSRQYRDSLKHGLLESRQQCEDLEKKDYEEMEKAEDELKWILKQGQFVREDLQDNSSEAAESAYVAELFNSFRLSSEEGQKVAAKKPKKALPRKKFRELVGTYLEAFKPETSEFGADAWCLALGRWLRSDVVKCAHIVPFSFDTKELSYMFGVEDATLRSPRNGLFLNKTVEKGLNNGWIAIVPDGSVEASPTEWKIVVLNEEIRNQTVYTILEPEKGLIRWDDLDGRRLQFLNENRPARRYMYFRYAMAYLHAQKENFPGFKTKLPSGTIWASPGKEDGYLRASVLQSLAKRIADEPLPLELMTAGTFTDTKPETGNAVSEKIAVIELSHRLVRRLRGVAESGEDLFDDEYEDDDEGEDDDEMEQ